METALENISEQVNMNVEVFLKEHGFQPRTEQQQISLKGQIVALKEKDNPIYILMCKLFYYFDKKCIY